MDEKILTQRIAGLLVEKTHIGQNNAESFLKTFFNLIQEALHEEKYVKVKGFGTFKIIEVDNAEGVGADANGRTANGHQKITFIPEPTIRDIINKPFADFETVVLNEGVSFDNLNEADKEQQIQENTTENAAGSETAGEAPTIEFAAEETPVSEEQKEGVAEGKVEEMAEDESHDEESLVEEKPIVEEPKENVAEEKADDKIKENVEEKIEDKPQAVETPVSKAKEGESDEEEVIKELEKERLRSQEEEANGSSDDAFTKTNAPANYSLHFAITLTLLLVVVIGGAIIYFCYPQLLNRQLQPKAVVGDTVMNKKAKVAPKPAMSLDDSIVMLHRLLTDAELRQQQERIDSANNVNAAENKTAQKEVENKKPASKHDEGKAAENKAQHKEKKQKEQEPQVEKEKKTEKIKTIAGHKVSGTMQTVTLQKGQTIFSLAKKYYGSKSYWTVIAQYNKNKISDPSDVKAGMKIKLPKIVK